MAALLTYCTFMIIIIIELNASYIHRIVHVQCSLFMQQSNKEVKWEM